MMMKVNVEEELKKTPTRQLLQLLNTARACGGSFIDCYEITVKQIKDELSTREHIPNKQEAKLIRQHKAKFKK